MKFIDTEGSENGRFVPGNPASGKRPTRLDHTFCNMVMDEIANTVIKGNPHLRPEEAINPALNDQLYQTVKRMVMHGYEIDPLPVLNGTKTLKTGFEDTPLKFKMSEKIKVIKFIAYIQRGNDARSVFTYCEKVCFLNKNDQGEVVWDWSASTQSSTDEFLFDIDSNGTLRYSCEKIVEEGQAYFGIMKIGHIQVLEC